MGGLLFTQNVINAIRRKSDLPPRLALARVLPLDKAADDSNIAEGAFQQGTTSHLVDKLLIHSVGGNQARGHGSGSKGIAPHTVIIADNAIRGQPRGFTPASLPH